MKRKIKMILLIALVAMIVGCSGLGQEESTSSDVAEQEQATASVPTRTPVDPSESTSSDVAEQEQTTASVPTRTPVDPSESASSDVAEQEQATVSVPTSTPVDPSNETIDLPAPENTLSEGEYEWSQLLGRDAIFPIYEPEFASAEDAPYDDEELVIGLELNEEAKAYAIGPLNRREIVNDTIGGVPILVTW